MPMPSELARAAAWAVKTWPSSVASEARGAMPAAPAPTPRHLPSVRNKGRGALFRFFDRLIMTAVERFRVGEMKIFPGYSFPNEKARRSTTSHSR
jgi:hypothetical protein